jgi:hypothetical protein
MGKGRGENNKRKGCGTCGKCCICLIATIVVLAVAIALTVYFLWPRPPKIEFKGVLPPEDPSKQLVLNNFADFTANQRLNITVDNPNYIGVVLSKITMEVIYVIQLYKKSIKYHFRVLWILFLTILLLLENLITKESLNPE